MKRNRFSIAMPLSRPLALLLIPLLCWAQEKARDFDVETGVLPISTQYAGDGAQEIGTAFLLAADSRRQIRYVTAAHVTGGERLSLNGSSIGAITNCRVVDGFHDIEVGNVENRDLHLKPLANLMVSGEAPEGDRIVADPAMLAAYLGVPPSLRPAVEGEKFLNLEVVSRSGGDRAFSLKTRWSLLEETQPATLGMWENWGHPNTPILDGAYSPLPFGFALDSEMLRRASIGYNILGGTFSVPVRLGPGQSGGPAFKFDPENLAYAIIGIGTNNRSGREGSQFAAQRHLLAAIQELKRHEQDGSCRGGKIFYMNDTRWKYDCVLYRDFGNGMREMFVAETPTGNGTNAPPGTKIPAGNGTNAPPGTQIATGNGTNAPPGKGSCSQNLESRSAIEWQNGPAVGFEVKLKSGKTIYLNGDLAGFDLVINHPNAYESAKPIRLHSPSFSLLQMPANHLAVPMENYRVESGMARPGSADAPKSFVEKVGDQMRISLFDPEQKESFEVWLDRDGRILDPISKKPAERFVPIFVVNRNGRNYRVDLQEWMLTSAEGVLARSESQVKALEEQIRSGKLGPIERLALRQAGIDPDKVGSESILNLLLQQEEAGGGYINFSVEGSNRWHREHFYNGKPIGNFSGQNGAPGMAPPPPQSSVSGS